MPTGHPNDGSKGGRPFAPRPFALAALAEAVRASSIDELAHRVGVCANTLHRARRAGGYITIDQADRWACAAGLHPFEVWGAEWFEPVPEALAS